LPTQIREAIELAEDLVARTRQELQERIAELEAMTNELPRLKAALAALGGPVDGPARAPRQPRRRTAANGRVRRRRPRGANRDAILAVIAQRPGASVGEVASVVEKQGVKKSVAYTTVSKLARDGIIEKDNGALTMTDSTVR
jgi:hypothetical protein